MAKINSLTYDIIAHITSMLFWLHAGIPNAMYEYECVCVCDTKTQIALLRSAVTFVYIFIYSRYCHFWLNDFFSNRNRQRASVD